MVQLLKKPEFLLRHQNEFERTLSSLHPRVGEIYGSLPALQKVVADLTYFLIMCPLFDRIPNLYIFRFFTWYFSIFVFCSKRNAIMSWDCAARGSTIIVIIISVMSCRIWSLYLQTFLNVTFHESYLSSRKFPMKTKWQFFHFTKTCAKRFLVC